MAVDDRQQGDLVLLPGQQCFLTDETKGSVTAYVGPSATPLGGNLTLVIYDSGKGMFRRAPGRVEDAIQQCPTASEGQYLILHNPAADGKHPTAGQPAPMTDLLTGKTQVFHGPITMAMYPGQWAEVFDGHRLDPSQYLLIEIINDDEAREHWHDSAMKRQTKITESVPADGDSDSNTTIVDEKQIPEFTTGSRLVIRGSDFSFYMPPTGVRVVLVPGQEKSFIRQACTMERLQYCILVSSKGEKRFPKGPQVIYPDSDEEFVQNTDKRATDKRIFRAIELSAISGIYVKVTADYLEDDGTQRKAGDELFITGADVAIYYPRPEHAVIRYGDQDIHYATVVPDGEGLYVLDRLTADIRVEHGHTTLLPDPRKDVIVRRVIDTDTCELYYPGNREALEHNLEMIGQRSEGAAPMAMAASMGSNSEGRHMTANFLDRGEDGEDNGLFAGDSFSRGTKYSKPRSIVLDTKYNGAVRIRPWTNYAVMINSADGSHRVVEGPGTILLEWNENLEVLKLSTGTPKNHDRTIRTVYLKVRNNTVSHVINATTKDFCEVGIAVTFRVNFEASTEEDKLKWFGVENYVEFLCVHMESLIRNAVRQYTVAEFNENQTSIVRDVVLGPASTDGTPRKGRSFDENGMKVYDVEVSGVEIDDDEVDTLLSASQRATFKQNIEKLGAQRRLEKKLQDEDIVRKEAEAEAETKNRLYELAMAQMERSQSKALAEIASSLEQREANKAIAELDQEARDMESTRALARDLAVANQQQVVSEAKQSLVLAKLEADTKAQQNLMGAIAPNVVSAMDRMADTELAIRMAEASSNWTTLLGTPNLAELLKTAFDGTPLGNVIDGVLGGKKE